MTMTFLDAFGCIESRAGPWDGHHGVVLPGLDATFSFAIALLSTKRDIATYCHTRTRYEHETSCNIFAPAMYAIGMANTNKYA